MSKYFMYGTELEELEQLMMLVPNFMPRGSGVIVVKKHDKKENLRCSDCNNYVGGQCSEKLAAGMICYKTIVENCYRGFKSYRFKKRLARLVRNFDGDIFINPIHRFRFYKVYRIQNVSMENRNPSYLAVLFLLTTDDWLWDLAKGHTYLDCFDFKRMNLKGINTYEYALYQTARTILLGREYIRIDEIADENLIKRIGKVESEGFKKRIAELEEFLQEADEELTGYDEAMVRKYMAYGLREHLMDKDDKVYVTNSLLELFERMEFTEEEIKEERILADILGDMCKYAYENGIIEDDTVTTTDLFDTKIMGHLTPVPSVVRKTLRKYTRQAVSLLQSTTISLAREQIISVQTTLQRMRSG